MTRTHDIFSEIVSPRRRLPAALIVAAVLVAAKLGVAAAGTQAAALDPSFGSGGVVRSIEGIEGGGIARYADGRIVVVGADAGEFVVARYFGDGTPDPGFGTAGVARVEWTAPFRDAQLDDAKASAVAVQSDGKILVGGSYEPNRGMYRGDAWRAVLARLNPDGSLDQGFRSENAPPGKVQLRRPFWREFRTIALQKTKIVVAGEAGFVARLNANGTLDQTFAGGRGSLSVPPLPKNRRRFTRLAGLTDLLVARSGRIFAAGYANGRFLLARLHPNGTFDRRFGSQGMVRVDASRRRGCRWCSVGQALARDRRGRIVISGAVLPSHPTGEFTADQAGGRPAALVRFRRNGKLDRSFGKRGIVSNRIVGNRGFRGGLGVAVQRDGRIVVAGQWFSKLALARYRPSGARDRSFFGNGIFSASFGSGYARGIAPLVLPDGRLVVMGNALFGEDRPSVLVARLLP